MKFEGRTTSRIIAMMVLYNYDINKELNLEKTIELIKNNNDLNLKDTETQLELTYDEKFLNDLVNGIIEKQDYLDYIISVTTEGYTLESMSCVDRNIIRLGTYEMIYMKTPKEVVINEMINISRAYSEIEDFKATKFDNAILDKIAKANFKAE